MGLPHARPVVFSPSDCDTPSMESFLFQATIYLGAAVIAVPLAARLGLGSVLGYLAAGIVIGPLLSFAVRGRVTGGHVAVA